MDLYSTILIDDKNELDIAQEFDFDDIDTEYIYRTFRPIIDVQTFSIPDIKNIIQQNKDEFILRNGVFDLTIFLRNEINVFVDYLKIYLDCLERRKCKRWDERKGKYFYYLKLDDERGTNAHTLLISDKNETQLEIYFKNIIKIVTSFMEENEIKEQNLPSKEIKSKKEILNSIWMPESNIKIEQFIKKGIDARIWDENFNIITQKGNLYGTGKTLLGSLAIALKGWAINSTTDYKKVGEVLCEVFNQVINENTKEPFHAFSSGNQNIIIQMKRVFNIK